MLKCLVACHLHAINWCLHSRGFIASNHPYWASAAQMGVGCFVGFHLEILMKAILIAATVAFVGYFAIGTGVSATEVVQDRHSQIEKVLKEAAN